MTKYLDPYSVRARFFPALLAVIPALSALAMLISWGDLGLTGVLVTAAIPVLVYAAADVARRLGKRIENKIYAEIGGKPSVAVLRHRDSTLDANSKEKYLNFLSKRVGQRAPSSQDEATDPAAADNYYEQCGIWLRENTRNTKKFPVLFMENVTYGFRRNLYGLKWPALALNAVIAAACLICIIFRSEMQIDAKFLAKIIAVFAFSMLHAAYMLWGVTKASLIEASRTYGRQLIISCDAFIKKI